MMPADASRASARLRRDPARRRRPTRRSPTTSRSGACSCRSASGSTCGPTCGPCACSRACRARSPAAPGDIDMLFVRENTEGEYSGVGGRVHQGHSGEVGIETAVFTRAGIERVVEHAFALAERAARRGDERDQVERLALRLRALGRGRRRGRRAPSRTSATSTCSSTRSRRAWCCGPTALDVVVASNLFGDILTDLGAAMQGGMGMAASANLGPGGDVPALFEPVHGSAPDIAGQGIANPCGAVWSAVLMLDHLGEAAASARLLAALEGVCRDGAAHARPRRQRDARRGRRRDPRPPAQPSCTRLPAEEPRARAREQRGDEREHAQVRERRGERVAAHGDVLQALREIGQRQEVRDHPDRRRGGGEREEHAAEEAMGSTIRFESAAVASSRVRRARRCTCRAR